MTGIVKGGKNVDLAQLKAEMVAAGMPITALGSDDDHIFTYDANGHPADLPAGAANVLAAHTINTALHDQLVATLTSAVGVSLTSLTQAQRLSLVVGLLYKADAIDKQSLTVKPLASWLI